MAIELFTQLTATGDQLEQQYKLRKRFCIDHLGWTDRNTVSGMEYDEYDHPAAVYIMWRDGTNTARAMARMTPCHLPYMIADHWPHLVTETPIANQPTQWEATRLCVERTLGKQIGNVIGEIMAATESLAISVGIKEYWWISPKQRIETILPHNHTYVGEGQKIGDEFCFVGYSNALEMVAPESRWILDAMEEIKIPRIAA